MNRTNVFLAILLTLGCVLWGVSYYINASEQNIKLALVTHITEQEKTLITLAELTDRNAADAVVSSIIRDCSTEDRNRFDILLDTLGSLDSTGLLEAEALFAGCADFEANRKAVMVARLEREFEVYSDYVSLHQTLDARSEVSLYPVDTWRQLIDFEKQRSLLLAEQVNIQGNIISALQSGAPVSSKTIKTSLAAARELVETFSVLDLQIDEIRGTLLDV